jgi:hypothetical protein
MMNSIEYRLIIDHQQDMLAEAQRISLARLVGQPDAKVTREFTWALANLLITLGLRLRSVARFHIPYYNQSDYRGVIG